MHQRLIHHAVALGEAHQRRYLLAGRVGVERQSQANVPQAHRNVFGHAKRTSEVEIALGLEQCIAKPDAERRRNGVERDPSAGDERLQQHVAGARACAGSPRRRVQAGGNERLARFDPAGYAFAEPPARSERD
jgi:hypothetical protein